MSLFRARLLMDLVAAALLLTALAYDWLGNATHEIVGTVMFLLLIAHNTFNRRWYGSAAKSGRDARGWLNIASILALLVTMLTLVATSVVISRTVFSFLPLSGSFGARQIHGLAAYWALLLASIHLGMRWPLIMAAVRSLIGITRPNRVRTMVLRVIAVAIAVYGIHSWMVIGVGPKLMAEIMLNFWNFEEAAVEFFVRHAAIVGLCAFLVHYCTLGMKSIGRGRRHLLQSGCHPETQNTRKDTTRDASI
ncbi:DUF4405 domain-containing protein [Rhizobium herbae]|uniref:Flavinylation-associated cytochrome domain-containing protein n=1 Tax=Rhizobium herbae TaxID=508661 RepID=A0ABS4EU54_9HYPH|nr:DUF4405 domain-containing protein [Rhizobium herbae]MBP1861484.1 hypothetical protein [Rhizobium herbae]